MGHHTLASADERNAFVWNTMTEGWQRRAPLCRVGCHRPEALTRRRHFDGTPPWSRDLDNYIRIDEALADQCDVENAGLNADLAEYRGSGDKASATALDRRYHPVVTDHLRRYTVGRGELTEFC